MSAIKDYANRYDICLYLDEDEMIGCKSWFEVGHDGFESIYEYPEYSHDYVLTYPFSIAEGHFIVSHRGVTSFKNFPRIVNGDLRVAGNKFRNVEGFPMIVNGDILLTSSSEVKSDMLKGIGDVLLECNGKIHIDSFIRSHLFGLLKVKT